VGLEGERFRRGSGYLLRVPLSFFSPGAIACKEVVDFRAIFSGIKIFIKKY
jgi:hypothetical protein